MESDRRAAEWHLAHRAAERSFADQARAVVSQLPEGALPVLDVGCGTAPLAASVIGAGHRYVGLERDAEMIGGSRRRPEAVSAVRAGADHIPFPGQSFKAVVALGLFEYLPNPAGTLGELARVTAPGGVILLTVPRRESLYRRGLAAAAPLLKVLGRKDPFDLSSGRVVTPAEAAEWATPAGLTLVSARPVAPALIPWPIDRLVPDRSPEELPASLGTAWLFRYACPAAPSGGE